MLRNMRWCFKKLMAPTSPLLLIQVCILPPIVFIGTVFLTASYTGFSAPSTETLHQLFFIYFGIAFFISAVIFIVDRKKRRAVKLISDVLSTFDRGFQDMLQNEVMANLYGLASAIMSLQKEEGLPEMVIINRRRLKELFNAAKLLGLLDHRTEEGGYRSLFVD